MSLPSSYGEDVKMNSIKNVCVVVDIYGNKIHWVIKILQNCKIYKTCKKWNEPFHFGGSME